ncbi:MAG: hypothetical protein SO445_02090 [Lachnospiraceae bacterium]|nr:hypothetical protein [Lachnospiraceae bacterium]MDD7379078.1 hypothetical protein [Lachnospiraceae bacterium]MDY4616494.1 hypothetical protein [Lachnospiraceae bacterium]
MKKDVREKLAKRVFVGMGVFLLTAVGLVTTKLSVMAATEGVVADTSTDASWLTTGETNEDIDEVTEKIKKIGETGLISIASLCGIAAVVCGIVAVIYLIEVKNINVDLRDVLVLAGVVIVLIVIAIRIL